MKKNYAFLLSVSLLFILFTFSCSKSDDENYVPVAPEIPEEPEVPVSPITVDLNAVPYAKLSDYKFFEGEMREQKPALDLLPYEPSSSLFTDYAHKKRFVWMPKNTKATYNSDGTTLELPVGSVLIKSFYYDNVQNTPNVGGSRIIETRIMIRKSTGWIFANYVWNDEQTEATFSLTGGSTPISWKDEHNVIKSTNYSIPPEDRCIVCHKFETPVPGAPKLVTNIPIGIKPQNLNFNYTYPDGTTKNQLVKWIEAGYLENNFNLPTAEHSTVDYNDTSKSLSQRARSYVDANCAHCHQNNRHCDYRPMRFAYLETLNNDANMGVCVNTSDMQDFPPALLKIVAPGNINRSMMYYRLNTTNVSYMMPLHGRTVIHEEGVELIRDWINSLAPCP